MSKTLLEASFPTVDLRAIYNRKAQPTTNTPEKGKALDLAAIENILITEKKVNPEAAKKIVGFGDPLKKAISVLGTEKNPILAFLVQEYTQNNLIKTGLLTAETFKAIFNAVASKLVSNEELAKDNDYNIIYCPDWYKKNLTEMITYLKIQKAIKGFLSDNRPKNKKVFFGDEKADARSAKLIDIKVAKETAGVDSDDTVETEEQAEKAQNSLSSFINKLTTPAEYFSVLSYLGMKSDVKEISTALAHEKFKSLTGEAIAKANQTVFKKLKNIKISEDTAKIVVSLIVSKLG